MNGRLPGHGRRLGMLPAVLGKVARGGAEAVVKSLWEAGLGNVFNFVFAGDGRAGVGREVSEGRGIHDRAAGVLTRGGTLLYVLGFYAKALAYRLKHARWLKRQDAVVVHRFLQAYVMVRFFPSKPTAYIHHGQGSVHDFQVDLLGAKTSRWFERWFKGREAWVYKRVAIAGFPSQGAHDALADTNPLAKKVLRRRGWRVLYNGVAAHPTVSQHNPDLEWKIDAKRVNFVSVSTLNNAKGVDRIPSVLSRLRRLGLDITWTLVGRGPQEELISTEIERAGIATRVHWRLGPYTRAEILGLFSRADVYIMLHRVAIFDLAILEAMSVGCVPVLSSVGGNREFVINNNGFLVEEQGDIALALKRYLEDRPSREVNARVVEEHFSIDRFAERYRRLAGELMGERPSLAVVRG